VLIFAEEGKKGACSIKQTSGELSLKKSRRFERVKQMSVEIVIRPKYPTEKIYLFFSIRD